MKKITFDLDKQFEMVKNENYLEGQLLVSTPAVGGDVFAKTVIYIFAHNAYGAIGLIVNRPINMLHYATLLQQLDIKITGDLPDLGVHYGGPVDENVGFVLHSNDYSSDDTITNESSFSVTSSAEILRDISLGKGPKQKLLAIGSAAWVSGQLESELDANSWIVVPATSELMFSADDEAKWGLAAKSLGVDMGRLSLASGHA